MKHDDKIFDWDDYFMGFAEYAALKSKDPSTEVGCAIFGEDGEMRSTGFNGIPRGVNDKEERMERPAKYTWMSHAEENAVAHAARVGVSLKGCDVYVTHQPCARCARLLIQAGVASVTVGTGHLAMKNHSPQEFEDAVTMFTEAGVELYRIKEIDSNRNRIAEAF